MKLKIIHGTCEDMSLIEDNSIGGCITSPPYFNAKDYASKSEGNIGNATEDSFNTPYQNYLNMMKNVFSEVYRVLKPGRYFMMNSSVVSVDTLKYPVPYHLFNILEEVGFQYRDCVVWHKFLKSAGQKRFGIVMQNPHPLYYMPNNVYEPCFLMRKGDSNYDAPKTPILVEKIKPIETDVWRIEPKRDSEHPAPFPYKFPWNFIYALVPRDETVLEPFGGSGTTAEAARDIGVDCTIFELEQQYVELIKKRLNNIGLGNFVDGAKHMDVEVIEQGKPKLRSKTQCCTPIKKIGNSNEFITPPLVVSPQKPSNKKQNYIYQRQVIYCKVCQAEMEIFDNKYYNYQTSKWMDFDGACLICGLKETVEKR